MYENWMWLCTAWTIALGLFFSLALWMFIGAPQRFESIAIGLKRRFAFAVSPNIVKQDAVYIMVLCLWVFTLSVLMNQSLLGGIPHVHDSVSQFFQAKIFSNGSLTAPEPTHPEFFRRLYILSDNGHWYSIYPPGFTLLLSIGVLLGVPNFVNPFLVAIAAPVLFFLTLQISSAPQARLAILFYALSPFTLIMGAGYMNHPTCLLFVLFFFIGVVKSISSNSKKKFYLWGAIAGFAFGYAYQTRPLTALAFGTIGGIWWLIDEKRPVLKRTKWTFIFLLGALLPLLFQFTYNNVTTGSPWMTPYQKQYSGIPLGFGEVAWISTELKPDKANTVYHTPIRGFSNSSRNLNGLNYWLFGWPVPSLTFAAILFLPGMKRTKFDWLCLACAFSLSVAYAFYFYQDFCYGPRFLYETSPFWLILTARGIYESYSFLHQNTLVSKQAAQGGMTLLIIVWFAWALFTAWPERLLDVSNAYWGVRDEVYAQLKNADIEKDAVIFIEYDYDYYAVFTFLDPWLQSGWIVAMDFGDQHNQLLVDEYPGWPVYRLYLSEDSPPDQAVTLLEPYQP